MPSPGVEREDDKPCEILENIEMKRTCRDGPWRLAHRLRFERINMH